MTKQEIELLAQWQIEIELIERHLKRIVREIEWKGNGKDKLSLYGAETGSDLNIGVVPDLKPKVLELIRDEYVEYLDAIIKRRDNLILCHEHKVSKFTPIEIV